MKFNPNDFWGIRKSNFNIGDKVRVMRIEDEDLYGVPELEEFIGKVGIVKSYYEGEADYDVRVKFKNKTMEFYDFELEKVI